MIAQAISRVIGSTETEALFCGVGLLVSLIFAIGLDLSEGFF
jgi:hypothetical protein